MDSYFYKSDILEATIQDYSLKQLFAAFWDALYEYLLITSIYLLNNPSYFSFPQFQEQLLWRGIIDGCLCTFLN